MPHVRALAAAFLAALAFPAVASAAYFDVAKLPPPPVDGKALADSIAAFSTEHALRATGTPNEVAAGDALQAEAERLGYKTENVLLPPAEGAPGAIFRAVVATKPGVTKPDEHLVLLGHYDTVAGYGTPPAVLTVNGAYDNASGTMMIRALAESFARIPTNRSLMFVWYNGEEQRLLASERHAAMSKEAGLKVRSVLGFDMTGIAYPVATPGPRTCLCMWHGESDESFEPLLRHVNFSVMGLPDAEGLVEVVGVNQRNSDERSWDVLDYPVMRWAGMRAAADYPAYHMPDDTIETMDTVAGGRSFLEQGLRNTLVSSYLTALALDNEMPVARATAKGTGPVTFSAAGSSDPDGPPAGFAWTFGDGTTATGATVTHTYAKAGTYTARLDVADNLWPAVTASVQVPVTVTTPPRPAKKPAKKASCKTKARKIKNAKKRKRALKRCAKAKKRKRG